MPPEGGLEVAAPRIASVPRNFGILSHPSLMLDELLESRVNARVAW